MRKKSSSVVVEVIVGVYVLGNSMFRGVALGVVLYGVVKIFEEAGRNLPPLITAVLIVGGVCFVVEPVINYVKQGRFEVKK